MESEQKMNATLEAILAYLSANNGTVTYQAMLDNIPFELRAQIPRALDLGRQNKTLKRRLVWDKDKGESILYLDSL